MENRAERLHPPRILLVEDDLGVARGLETLLVARGYSVDVAGDVSSAIRQVGRYPYRLVVADFNLGGEDGAEMVKRIRQLRPLLPVLAVTALDRDSVRLAVGELGVAECFEKPVDPESLLDAVERHAGPPL